MELTTDHGADGPVLPMTAGLAPTLVFRAPMALIAAQCALLAGEARCLAQAKERAGFAVLPDTADTVATASGVSALRGRRKPGFSGS